MSDAKGLMEITTLFVGANRGKDLDGIMIQWGLYDVAKFERVLIDLPQPFCVEQAGSQPAQHHQLPSE